MRTAAYYRDKAARFRQLVQDCEAQTAAMLLMLAADYEAQAEALEPTPDAEPPNPA